MSAGEALASEVAVGHRSTHSTHIGATRATGVCCAMISDNKTPHGVVPGSRHGNGRAERRNHRATITIAARSRSLFLVVILVRLDVRVGVAGEFLALGFFRDLNVTLIGLGQKVFDVR
jgi:hypothetical protein